MEVEKLKKHNMAAWSNELRKHGFNDLADSLDSDKNKDRERLKSFGLPVLDVLNVSYNEFVSKSYAVMEFIRKYGDLVVLTVPKKKGLSRSYRIGLKSYDEIKKFVDENILNDYDGYDISLIEHRVNIGSGIIISGDDRIVVEVADGYLDDLSYGKVIPFQGIYDFLSKNTSYSSNDEVKKRLINDSLSSIKRDNDFLKGYFEFIIVEGNRIIFFDHKENESYWKNI